MNQHRPQRSSRAAAEPAVTPFGSFLQSLATYVAGALSGVILSIGWWLLGMPAPDRWLQARDAAAEGAAGAQAGAPSGPQFEFYGMLSESEVPIEDVAEYEHLEPPEPAMPAGQALSTRDPEAILAGNLPPPPGSTAPATPAPAAGTAVPATPAGPGIADTEGAPPAPAAADAATGALPPTQPEPATEPRYLLQAGSFPSREDAERLRATLLLLGMGATTQSAQLPSGSVWYRVLVGPFSSRSDLFAAQRTLRAQNVDAIPLQQTRPAASSPG